MPPPPISVQLQSESKSNLNHFNYPCVSLSHGGPTLQPTAPKESTTYWSQRWLDIPLPQPAKAGGFYCSRSVWMILFIIFGCLNYMFLETAHLLGFSHRYISRVYRDENKNIQWAERKQMVTQPPLPKKTLVTQLKYAEEHLWTKTPETNGPQQQKTTPGVTIIRKEQETKAMVRLDAPTEYWGKKPTSWS